MDTEIVGQLSEAIFDVIDGYEANEKFNALMLCVASGIVAEAEGKNDRVFMLLGCNSTLLHFYIEQLSGDENESN